jgi:hypothetical protein
MFIYRYGMLMRRLFLADIPFSYVNVKKSTVPTSQLITGTGNHKEVLSRYLSFFCKFIQKIQRGLVLR